MARALERPPCLVSFSGGRDSSALLSVAVAVARREGLEPPVPMTVRFPAASAAYEAEWQATVVQHLGISDWIVLDVHDELDAVGPVATAAMRRHGLFWPFNAHFHIPIFERAIGGTVVTGFGGDELARSSETARAARALSRWHRPTWADVLAVGLASSPTPLRRVVQRRRGRAEARTLPWLTQHAVEEVARAIAAMEGDAPMGWEATIRRSMWRDRYFLVCSATFGVMGRYFDVDVVHPFLEPSVLDALAQAGGFAGFGDRTELMSTLFGDLLPAEVLARPTKASFDDPLWTASSRAFVKEWSGEGVDPVLVDAIALRAHWSGERWDPYSTTLLQQAWLHDRPPNR